jgi:hypothetical protein
MFLRTQENDYSQQLNGDDRALMPCNIGPEAIGFFA